VTDYDLLIALVRIKPNMQRYYDYRPRFKQWSLRKSPNYVLLTDAQAAAKLWCAAEVSISLPVSDGLPQTEKFKVAPLRDIKNTRGVENNIHPCPKPGNTGKPQKVLDPQKPSTVIPKIHRVEKVAQAPKPKPRVLPQVAGTKRASNPPPFR
jgi:hypothetical protein